MSYHLQTAMYIAHDGPACRQAGPSLMKNKFYTDEKLKYISAL